MSAPSEAEAREIYFGEAARLRTAAENLAPLTASDHGATVRFLQAMLRVGALVIAAMADPERRERVGAVCRALGFDGVGEFFGET